ncbi:MAG: FAD-binding oxidoreductase [Rhodoferax sp.]|nr:FAD-binding oxidoreductase [Rhodoferax sp.]MBP9930427.1 FAD-binding oxidoreductase [Rhodoferax sp.]HQX57738.1 FAD-binding oxidoreductase [Burkholderiaceae bacterium]HQZ05738.1 FAD-binding oxidoreductase [Burkholderiaceae bacterium]
MESFDVVIAGGAVVGSAAAYFLSAHPGFTGSVLVLEPDPSYAHCATTRSLASIRHQFSTPGNIRMSQFGTGFVRAAGELLAVDGVAPDVGFHEAGYLFLASPEGRAILQANHAVQRQCGVDVALLEPPLLAQRFAWLHTADLAVGSLGLSGEGWIDAHSLMHALRRKAMAQGVVYRAARVDSLQRQGDKLTALRLHDGTELACGAVVNAAGTGAARLAASAGIALPVQSRKRCVFFFQSPAQLAACPLVIDPGGVYFRPEGAGYLCGVALPADQDPECFDFDVQHALFEDTIWPALAHRVPGFEALRMLRSWAGHYDVNTLDHNLILGAHPEVSNLLFANGFSGHGLQQAPAVGRALAELLVAGRFETLDLSEFGWQRVIDERPMLEINVV